jgi:hypothetical protein
LYAPTIHIRTKNTGTITMITRMNKPLTIIRILSFVA